MGLTLNATYVSIWCSNVYHHHYAVKDSFKSPSTASLVRVHWLWLLYWKALRIWEMEYWAFIQTIRPSPDYGGKHAFGSLLWRLRGFKGSDLFLNAALYRPFVSIWPLRWKIWECLIQFARNQFNSWAAPSRFINIFTTIVAIMVRLWSLEYFNKDSIPVWDLLFAFPFSSRPI